MNFPTAEHTALAFAGFQYGSQACRQALIESHMPYVYGIAKRIVNPRAVPDVIAEGNLQLVLLVDKSFGRIQDYLHFTPYVCSSLRYRLKDWWIKHRFWGLSPKTVRKMFDTGLESELRELTESHPDPNDAFSVIQIKDIIDVAATSNREKQLVQLLIKGYAYRDIAPLMSLSLATISGMREKIQSRVEELLIAA